MDNHPCAFTLQSLIFCWRYLWSHRSARCAALHQAGLDTHLNVMQCNISAYAGVICGETMDDLQRVLPLTTGCRKMRNIWEWNGMDTSYIQILYIYRKLFHSPSRGVSHHRSRNVKLQHQWVANHPGLANAWPFTFSFRKTKPKWIDCPCARKKCVCVKERWRSPTLNHIESLFNLFTLLHCLK